MSGGAATYTENQPLYLLRHGYLEETYWTFSYSPVRDADGNVAGIFVATTDVTATVLSSGEWRRCGTGHGVHRGRETASDACRAAVGARRAAGPTCRSPAPTCGPIRRSTAMPGATPAPPPACAPGLGVVDDGEFEAGGRVAAADDLATRFAGDHRPVGALGDAPVDRALVLPLLAFGRSGPGGCAGARGQPVPRARRAVPGVRRAGREPGVDRADRRARLRGRTGPRGRARRAGRGEDPVLPERQPRVPHPADAAARPAADRARPSTATSCPQPQRTALDDRAPGGAAAAAGWWTRCSTSSAPRPTSCTPGRSRPTSAG